MWLVMELLIQYRFSMLQNQKHTHFHCKPVGISEIKMILHFEAKEIPTLSILSTVQIIKMHITELKFKCLI